MCLWFLFARGVRPIILVAWFLVLVRAGEFVAAPGAVELVAIARSAIAVVALFRVAVAAVVSRASALREVEACLLGRASISPEFVFLAAVAPVVAFSSAGVASHVGGAISRVVCLVFSRRAFLAVLAVALGILPFVFIFALFAFALVAVVLDSFLEALHAALALLVVVRHQCVQFFLTFLQRQEDVVRLVFFHHHESVLVSSLFAAPPKELLSVWSLPWRIVCRVVYAS